MKRLFLVCFAIMLVAAMILSSCASAPATSTYPKTQARPTVTTSAATQPDYRPPVTMTTTARPSTYPNPAAPGKNGSFSETLGFSTGGAKDIANFRENIRNNYLPLPTDITYEGLFYDYYFDTGAGEPSEKLFSPSYSFAVSRDPLSGQTEYYLSV